VDGVDEVTAALRELGRPERAVQEKRYLKSELDFLGVPLPEIRRVVKSALRQHETLDAIEWALALWDASLWERRAAAVEVLRARIATLTAEDLATVEQLIRQAAGWALVDPLAGDVAGPLARRHPGQAWPVIDRWPADPDFWIRRSALLALLSGIRAGDPDLGRLDAYATRMLPEKEFFIRKAIGWVLRELSKKDPAYVTGWTAAHARELSGVTFREATRHLPAEDVTMLCSIRSYLRVKFRSWNGRRSLPVSLPPRC
jgi:3-methyladenine DNA glycosylase AlkD